MKFLLGSLLSVSLFAQTSTVPAPAAQSQSNPGLVFDAAYYAAQNPILAPLFNGRPGSANPNGTNVCGTPAGNSIITQALGLKIPIDEQTMFFCWDPYTTMFVRFLQGIMWVPSGLGNAQCVSILQSGCVITPGQYSGTAPAGTILTDLNPADYKPFIPFSTISTSTLAVGVQIVGPYYEVLGDPIPVPGTVFSGIIPVGTKSCILSQIPNNSPFATGSMMNAWNCQ